MSSTYNIRYDKNKINPNVISTLYVEINDNLNLSFMRIGIETMDRVKKEKFIGLSKGNAVTFLTHSFSSFSKAIIDGELIQTPFDAARRALSTL